jgi:ribonucleoside-diphosphate reductase alpha chain
MTEDHNFIANCVAAHNCNLASICLPKYVTDDGYDHLALHKVAKVVTRNLNEIIDKNFYPVEKAKYSNSLHRPLGLGVQGLSDTFALMRYPFDSPEAKKLNKEIFETIYHGALETSMEIAKERKDLIAAGGDVKLIEEEKLLPEKYSGAYSSFVGSPAEQGLLQFDLWGVTPDSGRYDWNRLKADISDNGMRHSLLCALMPTASTSIVCGFNECFEPFTSNIYKRKTSAGEFILVNKYLINDLIKLNLWNNNMKERIMIDGGSIQNITEIPIDIRNLYKTAWDISQKHLIDMSRDRGAYVCQSQSLNLFIKEPNFKNISSANFYSFKQGLKTGSYYFRSQPKSKTQQFTIKPKRKLLVEESDSDGDGDGESECSSCGA